VGRTEDAIAHMLTALAIDPSLVTIRMELARAYALIGRWPECDALLDLSVEGGSARVARFLARARLCIWRGQTHPELDNPPPMGPETGISWNLRAFQDVIASRELTDDHRKMLAYNVDQADPGSRRRTLFCQINSELYCFVFEVDQALHAVEQAIESGLIDILWMDRCPVLAPLRADARFAPLRATVDARAQRVIAALKQ
jgi:eukaryotic-like serine/threonine-protein kinase